jgi:hypothetical protein
MTQLSKISAGKFTSLDYIPSTSTATALADISDLMVSDTNQKLVTLSTAGVPVRESLEGNVKHIGNVREFPSIGTPANVVNVPVYGQSTSSQVAGQSDAPSLEFSLNYVASEHAALDTLRQAGTRLLFRVRMTDSSNLVAAAAPNLGVPTAFVDDEFSDFYFFGTIASFEITTNLTDAIQATISLTVEGDFVGPASFTGTGTGEVYV